MEIPKLTFILLCCIILSRAFEVKPVTKYLLAGSAPHWNAETQKLYFVDVTNRTIHCYDPETEEHDFVKIDGGPVSFIIPVAGRTDEFLVSSGLDIRHIKWNGSSRQKPITFIQYSAKQPIDGSKFSIGKVDRSGRLWAGTMGPEPVSSLKKKGKLYSLTPFTGIVTHLDDELISGGLGWSIDGSVMYYTDVGNNAIESFDFDEESKLPLNNRNVVFNYTLQRIVGKPGGIAVDREGYLWLACNGGYQVIRVNPNTDTIVQRISIPAGQVTGLTWGGPNMEKLFITTSRNNLISSEINKYPYSGSVFVVTNLGVNIGYPNDNYAYYI